MRALRVLIASVARLACIRHTNTVRNKAIFGCVLIIYLSRRSVQIGHDYVQIRLAARRLRTSVDRSEPRRLFPQPKIDSAPFRSVGRVTVLLR